MSKEYDPTLDQRMSAGVHAMDIMDSRRREVRHDTARNMKITNRLYRAAALGLTVAGLAALNGALGSNEQHQRAVSDAPGQEYLQQGLKNGTIDPAMAVHLDK